MEPLKEYLPGMDFVAKTFAGLENMLTAELIDLGAIDAEPIKRGVKFRGDVAMMYKANYMARTAIRVLKPISVFEVNNEQDLYDHVLRIDWTKVFKLEQTFSVEANVFHSELTHSHFVALKTKDAIVDQFREVLGKRPWVDTDNPDVFVDVHLSHNLCTVSLDSSGHSLHKRGYRVAADKAPINEVLAAGMIRLAGWNGESDFYDPMCGSGTIPIEAAMIAMNIPAGYYRQKFAFMSWEGYDEAVWLQVKEEADSQMGELKHRIFASDRSEKAVGFTRNNLKSAGLHKDIEVECRFFDSVKPASKNGMIIMNPPYGMRLEEKGELRDLYRGIGDTLKKNFTGFDAWIITPSIDTFKFIGLRPARRIPLYNGPIETRFLKFEVYQGSKRYGEENRDTTPVAREKRKWDSGDKPRSDREGGYHKDSPSDRREDLPKRERREDRPGSDRTSERPFREKRNDKPPFERRERPADDRRSPRTTEAKKPEERSPESERRREWEQSGHDGNRSRIRSYVSPKDGQSKKSTRKHRRPRTDELGE
ncbi:MAG: THUMP domain-containing protein [Bacteroidales bacterium]|nr:THUMP domain-containing protein [Bacteroidales bacterium]